jgi:hypothetical protein
MNIKIGVTDVLIENDASGRITVEHITPPQKKVKAYRWVYRSGGQLLVTQTHYRDSRAAVVLTEPVQRIDSEYVEVDE